MALKSIYLPDTVRGDTVVISGDEHHHLSVGRAESGETIEILDGRGQVCTARIQSVSRRETAARIVGRRLVPPDPHPVVLALALIRSAAFELALEKVVELGVSRIIPFTARRSNTASPRKLERWERIVVEAAKQSKRYHFPSIEEPVGWPQVLSVSARSRILFSERNGGPLRTALVGSPVLYVIGPEGGWSDEEMDSASKQGFVHVGLGQGILRSETAAIAGATLIRYELEDF